MKGFLCNFTIMLISRTTKKTQKRILINKLTMTMHIPIVVDKKIVGKNEMNLRTKILRYSLLTLSIYISSRN